jgi:hypothetical protein
MNRDKEVADIRKLARKLAPPTCDDMGRGCVYLAAATKMYMSRVWGHRDILIQAGSTSWRRLNPEQDDGKPTTFTHFTYKFDLGHPDSINALRRGCMPELHAWCYDERMGFLIDVTTGDQERMCLAMAGMDWPGDKLPDYLWCPFSDLPPGTVYTPDRNAIKIAHEGIRATCDEEVRNDFLKFGRV